MTTISKTALVRLLDGYCYPDPDDTDPVGPGGPVIRRWGWVLLNPQPLPPRWARGQLQRSLASVPGRASLDAAGPLPEPWHAALVTRAVISRSLEQFENAGIIIVSGDTERAAEAVGETLRNYVDDICPDPPKPPIPWPRPWGPLLDPEDLDPIALLVAGAQFQRVADTIGDHPLQPSFEENADRLFEVGLARLEQADC